MNGAVTAYDDYGTIFAGSLHGALFRFSLQPGFDVLGLCLFCTAAHEGAMFVHVSTVGGGVEDYEGLARLCFHIKLLPWDL